MSYILDALKKSDHERQQGTAPTLHSVHGYAPRFKGSGQTARRRVLWIMGTVLIVLFSGALLFTGYKHFTGENDASIVVVPPLQNIDLVVTLPEEQTEEILKGEGNSSIIQTKKTDSPTVITREKTKISLPATGAVVIADNKSPIKEEEERSVGSTPLLRDLPTDIQQSIPEFNFAGHTYAVDPAQRMIIINNNILREGDKIDPLTRLLKITWEGVIIDYKNIVFQVNTN